MMKGSMYVYNNLCIIVIIVNEVHRNLGNIEKLRCRYDRRKYHDTIISTIHNLFTLASVSALLCSSYQSNVDLCSHG